MAEKKKDAPVTLIAINGMTVSVAASKVDERLATGYQLPGSRTGTRRSK